MKIFSRKRVGLRKPSEGYDPAGVITECSIHHGGDVGKPRLTFKSAAATWRSFQAFHMDNRGWKDVGYNAGIDGRGRLYEGRPVGALPAAVGGGNYNSIGLCFLRDGSLIKLNWMERRTFKRLFEKGCPELRIPPLHTLRVRGHNEYQGHETNACPGRFISRHLRWLRGRNYRNA